GDVTISQVSNSTVDWVTLHNNLNRDIDLRGFVFTDGDNIFTFPGESVVPASGDLRVAASKDEGDITEPVDLYWGDWGLSEDGELILLINDTGDMVVDFVFAQSLENGELLERIPVGTGPLMDPVKSQPMQMQRPSYRAVPAESIDGLGQDFSTAVVSFGGLLTGIATFLINLDQAREIIGKVGLFGRRKKG
ncbi:MAG TPA: lamin tail domain-containing protein, partial [Pyrinomonadaceae bacterium]